MGEIHRRACLPAGLHTVQRDFLLGRIAEATRFGGKTQSTFTNQPATDGMTLLTLVGILREEKAPQ